MAFKVHLPRTRVNRGTLSVIKRNATLFAMLFLSLKVAQYMLTSAREYWNSLPAPTFRARESNLDGELPRFMHTLTLGEDPFPLSITSHMNKNWTLKEYDIKRGREYVSRHCREHVEAFDVLNPTAFKADLLRYCILFTEGGIWIDDDIVLTQSIDTMTRNMRHDHLFVFDRRVYKLLGGPYQIWNAFMVSTPQSRVFECALKRISDNVRRRKHYSHSLYYTGPALLYGCVKSSDSIDFRWRVQHREALTRGSCRIADSRTDEEVMLRFKLKRLTTHYSKLSRRNDVYN